MSAIRKDDSLAREARTRQLHELREASAAKVRGLLDDDQKVRFDEMRRDTAERARERHERGDDCAMIWNVLD
jgi:hypothetical protein